MEVGSAPSKFSRAFSVVEREDGVVVVVVVDPVVVVAKKPVAAPDRNAPLAAEGLEEELLAGILDAGGR